MAPRAGFEPATNRLTAGCSTAELPRKNIQSLINEQGYSKAVLICKEKNFFFLKNIRNSIERGKKVEEVVCHLTNMFSSLIDNFHIILMRPCGGMVTQRTANPCIPVRFRARPPIYFDLFN